MNHLRREGKCVVLARASSWYCGGEIQRSCWGVILVSADCQGVQSTGRGRAEPKRTVARSSVDGPRGGPGQERIVLRTQLSCGYHLAQSYIRVLRYQ